MSVAQLSGILWSLSSDVDARAAYVRELIGRFSASSQWSRRQMSVVYVFCMSIL